jgi:endonuclease G
MRHTQQNVWHPGWIGYYIIGLVMSLTLLGCTWIKPSLKLTDENPNLLLGNPSAAVSDVAQPNNYLIATPQYVLSYNRDRGIPNWVSWQLNQSWLGELGRSPFEPNPSLPSGWYRVTPDDYTGSGFDRGHLVPAADRDKTEADRQSVFLMTNIVPQAPDNNRGPWEALERYCRDLAKQGKDLYIIAGGTGTGGIGTKGARMTIAHGKVAVPKRLWKIIVIVNRPDLKLSGITQSTRVIAVIMPNQQGIDETNWKAFRTSVDAIEQLTGYDFLSNLPDATEAAIEAQVDRN